MNLDFLYVPIAWVLKQWHSLLSTFLEPTSGAAWVLSIMLLVVTVRILLFPIFVKMIKSQRAMQELQPEIAKLRKEYGSDRQGMALAMQQLQKERGVNPLAGCLPILLQAPVFIALLHVLRRLQPNPDGTYDGRGLYTWSDSLTQSAAEAQVFGAPVSSNFTMSGHKLDLLVAATGTSTGTIKLVTGILIVVMAVTQFITTKQIMKRSATGEINAQMQMVQKLMLYGAPIGLLISGMIFPLGVLLYWFFNNLWTIGQQFWVLKKMPPPGQTQSKLEPEVDRTKLAPRPGAKPAVKSKAPAQVKSTEKTDEEASSAEPEAAKSQAKDSSNSRAKSAVTENVGWRDRRRARKSEAPAQSEAPAREPATDSESTSSGGGSAKSAKPQGTASSTKPKPGAKPQQMRRKKR